MKHLRYLWTVVAVALALTANVGAHASQHELCGVDLTDANPSAVITAKVSSIGFLVGVRWGTGILTMANGGQRKFRILGAKVLETGAAKSVIDGEVYNLHSVDDFEGTYLGASQKISIVKSAGEGIANNAKCVVVKYRAVGAGLQLSAPAPGGVEVHYID